MYQSVDMQQFPQIPLEDSRIWWGPRPWFYSPVVYRPWWFY
ncbi:MULTISPECIES: hypothetical protein [Bacillaceae]|nr:hypothetical protein [Ectobacillus funiculus]